jgi:hypothetical protein
MTKGERPPQLNCAKLVLPYKINLVSFVALCNKNLDGNTETRRTTLSEAADWVLFIPHSILIVIPLFRWAGACPRTFVKQFYHLTRFVVN